jgi:hypothetical protein
MAWSGRRNGSHSLYQPLSKDSVQEHAKNDHMTASTERWAPCYEPRVYNHFNHCMMAKMDTGDKEMSPMLKWFKGLRSTECRQLGSLFNPFA